MLWFRIRRGEGSSRDVNARASKADLETMGQDSVNVARRLLVSFRCTRTVTMQIRRSFAARELGGNGHAPRVGPQWLLGLAALALPRGTASSN
jgi:hypothetical protein